MGCLLDLKRKSNADTITFFSRVRLTFNQKQRTEREGVTFTCPYVWRTDSSNEILVQTEPSVKGSIQLRQTINRFSVREKVE